MTRRERGRYRERKSESQSEIGKGRGRALYVAYMFTMQRTISVFYLFIVYGKASE